MNQLENLAARKDYVEASPQLALTQANIQRHVEMLAGKIGSRSLMDNPAKLRQAEQYITDTLSGMGFPVQKHTFAIQAGAHTYPVSGTAYELPADAEVSNIFVDIPGKDPSKQIIVFAHYDSYYWNEASWTPGADDNASSVAVLLETARMLKTHYESTNTQPDVTLRCMWPVNEEPPFFRDNERMGSRRYAHEHPDGNLPIMAIALDMLGFYKGSNSPDKFITLIGLPGSEALLDKIAKIFAEDPAFPLLTILAYDNNGNLVPEEADFSDHQAYLDIPSVMATDAVSATRRGAGRNPNYHTPDDLPDTLHYPSLAILTEKFTQVLSQLA